MLLNPGPIRYIDMSQLNQRWHNALPLTGLGGLADPDHSGGIFGPNILRSYEAGGTPPPASALGELRGLGGSVLPGSCWDKPGFSDCHADQWRAARSVCDPDYGGADDYLGYSSIPACIEYMTDANAFNNCVPKYCPQPARGRVDVGPVYANGELCAADNTVKFVQFNIGTGVDGKWGPKSAAALAKDGRTYREIATNCTGDCPAGVGEPGCSGGTPVVCPPGQILQFESTQEAMLWESMAQEAGGGGYCVDVPPPTCPAGQSRVGADCVTLCNNEGGQCPCCAGLECGTDGICRKAGAKGEAKSSMMWLGLLGVGLLGAVAYSASQKKKGRRPNRRRRNRRAYA